MGAARRCILQGSLKRESDRSEEAPALRLCRPRALHPDIIQTSEDWSLDAVKAIVEAKRSISIEIRPAVATDARGVAQVHVLTWQTAYRGLVPDAYLDSLSVDEREQRWSEAIAKSAPELWVAESDTRVVGWTAFGPSRDADAAPGTGELEAIYVTPAYWSKGIGRSLWLLTRGRLSKRGFSSVTLWVLTGNARAIRFYQAAGFLPEPASEKEIRLGGLGLKEIRYETAIGITG